MLGACPRIVELPCSCDELSFDQGCYLDAGVKTIDLCLSEIRDTFGEGVFVFRGFTILSCMPR